MLTPMDTLAQSYERSERRLAFRADDEQDAGVWRKTLRAKLAGLSGLDRMKGWRCEPRSEEDFPEDLGDHTRQRALLQTAPDYWMPLYVLKPKSDGPFTPVIALHGLCRDPLVAVRHVPGMPPGPLRLASGPATRLQAG